MSELAKEVQAVGKSGFLEKFRGENIEKFNENTYLLSMLNIVLIRFEKLGVADSNTSVSSLNSPVITDSLIALTGYVSDIVLNVTGASTADLKTDNLSDEDLRNLLSDLDSRLSSMMRKLKLYTDREKLLEDEEFKTFCINTLSLIDELDKFESYVIDECEDISEKVVDLTS